MKLPTFETLKLEYQRHVATVWLNRPEKANAMNVPMWAELQACFEWLDSEPQVRVVILAGLGKTYCAGIDLAMFADLMPAEGVDPARAAEKLRQFIKRLQANLTSIERCQKPVLAAVHSNCVGGGVDLIACCDMRYASEEAVFSIKEIDVGMTADVGSLQRLPHIMPQGIVRELAFTGRNVNAAEAHEIGLVNRVYATREALMAGVREVADAIAARSPISIRGVKEMLLYARDHSVDDGLNYIATWNAGMMSQRDVMAAVASAPGEQPEFEN
jgi:enoyl-CoA hydratase